MSSATTHRMIYSCGHGVPCPYDSIERLREEQTPCLEFFVIRQRLASTMEEQHELQEKIQGLEKKKRRQRQQIFDSEEEIAQKRDDLISALERRMTQKTTSELLFTIAWKVV